MSVTELLGLLLAMDLVVAAYLAFRLVREAKQAKTVRAHLEKQDARLASLEQEIERLRPYAAVPDAEGQAAAILKAAREQAVEISAKYQNYVREVIEWTTEAFETATAQASQIVATARTNGHEAPPNRLFNENTAATRKDAVEGPLDREILPSGRLPLPENWLQNEMPFDGISAEPDEEKTESKTRAA